MIIAQVPVQQIANAGFLPTRGSFMLDFLFLALFGLVILMGISIWLVRSRRQYALHKRIQVLLAVVLLVTVVAFEVDVRFVTDWRVLAAASPYYDSGLVDWALGVHLVFAIPTPLVWIFTIVQAMRKMPDPPAPGAYSSRHRNWGWMSVILLNLTAVTGWCFYLVAFAA